jgi:putative Holliday junction resolvase
MRHAFSTRGSSAETITVNSFAGEQDKYDLTEEGREQAKKAGEKLKKEKIDKVIVGLPIGLNGTENKNTERIRKFIEQLKLEIDVPVEFFDERFSSQEADAMGGGVSRDEKSAMIILQSYTEHRKHNQTDTL